MKPISISTTAPLSESNTNQSHWLRQKLRPHLIAEAIRYLGASAIALGLDFFIYIGLIRWAGLNYQVAAVAGFSLGLVAIYILSVKVVFRARTVGNPMAEFILFAGIGIAGLVLNNLILYVAVDLFHQSYGLSKGISAGMIFCFNFVLRKFMLFNRKEK